MRPDPGRQLCTYADSANQMCAIFRLIVGGSAAVVWCSRGLILTRTCRMVCLLHWFMGTLSFNDERRLSPRHRAEGSAASASSSSMAQRAGNRHCRHQPSAGDAGRYLRIPASRYGHPVSSVMHPTPGVQARPRSRSDLPMDPARGLPDIRVSRLVSGDEASLLLLAELRLQRVHAQVTGLLAFMLLCVSSPSGTCRWPSLSHSTVAAERISNPPGTKQLAQRLIGGTVLRERDRHWLFSHPRRRPSSAARLSVRLPLGDKFVWDCEPAG